MIKIYPEKLELFLMNNTHYLPRQVTSREHLKRYHRYWLTLSEEYIKVKDIYLVKDTEYYTVKYSKSLFGSLSYPVEEIGYELLIDKINLHNVKEIVNTKTSYSGAQIKYWFFIHREELDHLKYEGFLPFLDPMSESKISDDKYYFLYAKNCNNIYKNCKILLNRAKEIKQVI